MVADTGGTEIQFADGAFVVDDVYVPAIMEATKRHPERFPRQRAMELMNEVFARDHVRNAMSKARADHLRVHGLR